MSKYPAAIDDDTSLYLTADNVQTSLNASVGIADTAVVVASGAGFAPNMVITIVDAANSAGKATAWEHMFVTAVAGNVLTVTRGFAGTVAASHSSGKPVSVLIDSIHQSSLKSAVIAIQAALGPNLSAIPVALPFVMSPGHIFAPQSPGGSLVPGNNTIILTPVPLGVNGTNTQHYLYVSGGTGTAEACLITGGSGISGATSGQIIIQCANAHSGAWTIQSATGGIQEAIWRAQGSGSRAVCCPSGPANVTIHAPIYIPIGMTGGSLAGYGSHGSFIQAVSPFQGSSMILAEATLSGFTLADLSFDVANISTITTAINLARTPESSIRHQVNNITVVNAPSNSTILNLNGCEDSNLINSTFTKASGATGVTAVAWHVPAGNIHIRGCTMFDELKLEYQCASILSSTTGGIVADGIAYSLTVQEVYGYASTANFRTTGANAFGGITISGSYFNPNGQNNITAFSGRYNHYVHLTGGNYFDGTGTTGYSLLGSATVSSGTQCVFDIRGAANLISGQIGTPGANVSTSLTTDAGNPVATRRTVPMSAPVVSVTVTLANGQNNNIAIDPAVSGAPGYAACGSKYVRVNGPTAAFSITGFVGGTAGSILYVYNSSGQQMTIKQNTGSSVGNVIFTLTGADVVLRSGQSFATFMYDGTGGLWVLTSTN